MNTRLSASSLLAKVKQDQENATAVKTCWEASLPVPAPSQFELMQMVRTVSLDHLVEGIDSYAKLISKREEKRERLEAEGQELLPDKYPLTTLNAKNYACSTGRNLDEAEDPQDDRPETPRRRRRLMVEGMGDFREATNEADVHLGSTVARTFRAARRVSPTKSLRFTLRIEARTCVESVRISLRARTRPRALHFSRSRCKSDISACPSISRSRKRDRME